MIKYKAKEPIGKVNKVGKWYKNVNNEKRKTHN